MSRPPTAHTSSSSSSSSSGRDHVSEENNSLAQLSGRPASGWGRRRDAPAARHAAPVVVVGRPAGLGPGFPAQPPPPAPFTSPKQRTCVTFQGRRSTSLLGFARLAHRQQLPLRWQPSSERDRDPDPGRGGANEQPQAGRRRPLTSSSPSRVAPHMTTPPPSISRRCPLKLPISRFSSAPLSPSPTLHL